MGRYLQLVVQRVQRGLVPLQVVLVVLAVLHQLLRELAACLLLGRLVGGARVAPAGHAERVLLVLDGALPVALMLLPHPFNVL